MEDMRELLDNWCHEEGVSWKPCYGDKFIDHHITET